MVYISLILQAAGLALLALIFKRQSDIFNELRIPPVKKISPDLKLKSLPHPGSRPQEGRAQESRPQGDRPQSENGNRLQDNRNRPQGGERRDSRGERGDRGDRNQPRGERGERSERGDRGERGGDRNRGRGDRPFREDRGEQRPPRTEGEAPAAAPVAEGAPKSEPAQQPSFSGRRPLPGSTAPQAPRAEVAPASDSSAAIAPLPAAGGDEQPIRHGRRTLPKPKPKLDEIQIDEESTPAAG